MCMLGGKFKFENLKKAFNEASIACKTQLDKVLEGNLTKLLGLSNCLT